MRGLAPLLGPVTTMKAFHEGPGADSSVIRGSTLHVKRWIDLALKLVSPVLSQECPLHLALPLAQSWTDLWPKSRRRRRAAARRRLDSEIRL